MIVSFQRPRLAWPFAPGVTLLLCALLAGLPASWSVLRCFDAAIAREHGPMENFQAACLLGGLLILLALWLSRANRPVRALVFGLGVLHLNLFALEFDTREWDIATLDFFFRGTSRDVMLIIAWGIAIVVAARAPRAAWFVFARWLPTRSGTLMWFAGVWWVVGGVIDKTKPCASDGANLFMEEVMETNAALLMLLSVSYLLRALVREKAAPVSLS
jgi:hypothetical protein